MGVVLRRRLLNMIVAGCSPGVKSLRRINLAELFYRGGTPPPPPPKTTEMETLRLPPPTFTFRSLNNEWNLNCFPFADTKVICGDDRSGLGFLFDVDSRTAMTMPPLLKLPTTAKPAVSVFVHKPHVDYDVWDNSNGSSLFLMERIPHLEPQPISNEARESEQFVAFVNHNPSGPWGDKSLTGRLLPPPPFVRESCSWYNNTPEITAYGVVGVGVGGGGGSHVCISVEGVGTYCLDTADHTWDKVGDWTLPFHGKVEYVPELKLWFGLSAADAGRHLAAADLSDVMDSHQRPQLVAVGGPWKKELDDPPEEWKECEDPQIVSLGSGRFCIARFFSFQGGAAGSGGGDKVAHKNFTVLTGVEVHGSSGKGEGSSSTGKVVELQMTPHRSRRVDNSTSIIETLF